MQIVPDLLAQTAVHSCASEPIHIPGSIQPHGLLLLFDEISGKLAHWAGDFERLLGIVPAAGSSARQLLGASLDELIRPRRTGSGEEAAYVGDMRPAGRARLSIQAHYAGEFVCIELQEAGEQGSATSALEHVRAISGRIASKSSLTEASNAAADEVRGITGFDRVMIYRFLEDSSGLVIAEARASDAGAFFNHRFPASDIPPQARELYKRSLIRTFPDVTYQPWRITPQPTLPIDLSHCVLRSVSPVHIQYLKNMDVGASMSVSLVVEDQLWGLIACHHRTSRAMPVEAQLLCRHVGTSLSAFILSCSQAEIALLDNLQRTAVESALRSLRSSGDPERTLRSSASVLKGLVQCGGFALMADGDLVASAGRVPAVDELRSLAPLVETQLEGRDSYWTDRAGDALPGTESMASDASGVLAVRVDASQPMLAMWLRPEQIEEVEWAGDPGLKNAASDNFGRLNPRRSFATWRETVRGRSRPWTWYEISAVGLFQSRAGFILQRHRLRQLNAQLADANAGLSALATTDPLTGLPNRRLFEQRLQVEWERALRQSKPLGLIAIDVDHFKLYNDCFGHPAGDDCLRKVASAIDAARRSMDIAARIGGEEFAIVLPDIDAEGLASVAERVRASIENLALEHPQTARGLVTVSLGSAVGAPELTADPAELVKAADRALYEAKGGGRNRVVASP